MNIPTLKGITNRLEDSILTISGPALAISGIIAGVDLLMGGAVMTSVAWMSLAWAICLMISLDFQVLSLGARAHKVYLSDKSRGRKVCEIGLALLIAAGISAVSVQMQSIIARSNSVLGLSIAEATAQLGINPIWLTWERSALVLLLIFLSGWFREEHVPHVVPQGNASTISEETVQVILAKLEKLDHLEQALREQTVTIVPEPVTPVTIPETPVTKGGTNPETDKIERPAALFPDVPGVFPDEVKSVVDAYLADIAKRDICSYLKWGNKKYGTKVKPVLDAFLGQEHFVTGQEQSVTQ